MLWRHLECSRLCCQSVSVTSASSFCSVYEPLLTPVTHQFPRALIRAISMYSSYMHRKKLFPKVHPPRDNLMKLTQLRHTTRTWEHWQPKYSPLIPVDDFHDPVLTRICIKSAKETIHSFSSSCSSRRGNAALGEAHYFARISWRTWKLVLAGHNLPLNGKLQ